MVCSYQCEREKESQEEKVQEGRVKRNETVIKVNSTKEEREGAGNKRLQLVSTATARVSVCVGGEGGRCCFENCSH